MYTLKNKVQLIGAVAIKPTIETTESGKKFARICITTFEVYRNTKGEKVTETQLHSLVGWGKVAEVCELFLQAGTEIIIDGKLLTRIKRGQDGSQTFFSEILIQEMLVLNQRPNRQKEQA